MDPSYNNKSFFKLIQLKKALLHGYKIEIIQRLLDEEYDIDYAFPDNESMKKSESYHIGNTALHLACSIDYSDVFMHLLDRGADFTKINKAGNTVLHNLIRGEDNKEPINNLLINAVLSAHVRTNNFSNPCNKNGLSHFHIACMTNNSTRAIEFFLDNGISVDEPVAMNSTYLPRFTPLHFAAMYTNTKVAEILFAYGANMHILDASGKTPLHILIERRMEMLDSLAVLNSSQMEKLLEQIQENDKMINMLLESMSSDNDCLDTIGLSNIHVACMLQDMSIAEHLADQVADLNHCVHKNSKLWPGYTALHFAAQFSARTVEMLIKKGANIELKDSNGLTPLDVCIERFKIEDICSIISLYAQWKNIYFSDGETTLVSLMGALADVDSFKNFIKYSNKDINMRIPMESTLWPGYTPLHLAVLFAERSMLCEHSEDRKGRDLQLLKFCLSQGADLSLQDSQSQTPLHHAFRLHKETVVDILFRHSRQIPNVSDRDNLSHLHIACAVSNRKPKLKKCVLDNLVVNMAYKGSTEVNTVKPGWTPLHVALMDTSTLYYNDSRTTVINTLLKYGADPNIKDAFGLTPIHWLLNYNLESVTINKLLNKAPNDCVAEEYGLSYLHIACQADHCTAVKRFLKNGANVNLAIKYNHRSNGDPLYFLSDYDKKTPLHMIRLVSSGKVAKLLIKHGADMLAREAHGWAPRGLFDNLIPKLLNDNELENRMREEFGWTKLHLACHFLQVDGFESLVKTELAEVNAQVYSNSPIWKGYTPLHRLTCRLNSLSSRSDDVNEKIYSMMKILLENGADVTVMNDEQDTPLSILFTDYADYKANEQASLLMKYHKNYNVNPVNKLQISHFHRACQLNDVDAIKGFLSHGVDANHPIGYLSYWRPGYTPLHLASKSEVIDLLVSHGADVHIEGVDGYTVLHNAVNCANFDENCIIKIIESGAEINSPNFRGITPFEAAISNYEITMEKLQFFIKQGFHVNSCNPITGVGYVSMMLTKSYRDKNLQKTLIEMMMFERSINIFGRTSLHHLVAKWSYLPIDCIALLEKLIKAGHDIDEQDDEGKTALHLAMEFQNGACLKQLLVSGADMNVLDNHRQSPLSFIKSAQKSPRTEYLKNVLTVHACRLVLLNLDLNQIDMDDVRNAPKSIHATAAQPEFIEQVALSKEIGLGVRSIRLYDFLSETGVLTIYPKLNHLERCRIDQYFENLNSDDRLNEIRSLLNLQYKKAVKRSKLFFPAMNSLRRLLDFNLPELCAENLFHYLRNSDLQNVIRADIETEDEQMDVD